MHIVATARRPPICSSPFTAVSASRAPEHAQRMAQRDAAALGVHLRRVVRQAQVAQNRQCLRGERLVQLDQVHIVQPQPQLGLTACGSPAPAPCP